MARLESRAAFARLAGVSAMAISKACDAGKLKAACQGKRVDLDHPAAVAYLESKGRTPTAPSPAPAKPARDGGGEPTAGRPKARSGGRSSQPSVPGSPDELTGVRIEDIEHLSVREVTDRYGTVVAVKDWLDARKKIADIREKDLKNAETEGLLIERELVRVHVFGAIEAANLRILSDAPKNISRRLYAAAKAGVSIEEAEAIVRETLSALLKPVKTKAARVLRGSNG